jgi:hypothetical protein
MSDPLTVALEAVVQRVRALAETDAALRAELRRLAQALLEAMEAPREMPDEAAVVQPAAESADPPLAVAPPAPAPARAPRMPLPELTFRPPEPPSPPEYPARWLPATADDFPLVEARCRLKAEATRWAVTRRQLLAEGADYRTEIEPRNQALIARAKALPDCFLWMCHPAGPAPADSALYEDVAGCFDTLADAVALMRTVLDERELPPGEFEQALDLLAEAQSALRAAVARMDALADRDQNQVFNWLKATAAERQIYIRRFMRVDDPADPQRWRDLAARVAAAATRLQQSRKRAGQRRKLFGKIRHKLSLIAAGEGDLAGHWRILAAAVDELVRDGVPPSNTELRDLLLPVIEDVPELDEMPRGFEMVLREIDRYVANSPTEEPRAVHQELSAEAREVARLLAGRSMVLIGGDRRPGAAEALKRNFRLQELYWIEAREHQSIAGFEPYIARPDVAVVILAIRWSSHSFGEVKEFCDRHGKPLVRLPAGYNTNQVAAQIMAQCSERLVRS